MIFFNKNSGKTEKKKEEKRVWDLDETSDYPNIFNSPEPKEESHKEEQATPSVQSQPNTEPKVNGLANGSTRSGMFGGSNKGKDDQPHKSIETEKNSNNLEMAKKFLEMSGKREEDGSYSKVPYSPMKDTPTNKTENEVPNSVPEKQTENSTFPAPKKEKIRTNGIQELYGSTPNYETGVYNGSPQVDKDTHQVQEKDVLTIQEASAFFGISVSTFRKILKAENVPARKIGRSWRFSRQALVNWIEQGKSVDYKKEQIPEDSPQ